MKTHLVTTALMLLVACSGSDSNTDVATGGSTSSTGGAGSTGGASTSTGGSSLTGGSLSSGGDTTSGGSQTSGGMQASGGSAQTGGVSDTGGSDTSPPTWNAGNPDGSCTAGVPAEGQPVDTSSPTVVVGTGTPDSCTQAALSSAVAAGGIITFDCGSDPVTIAITETLNAPIDKDTVIDGGQLVTLDGQNSVQILRFDSPNFQAVETRLTLQHLRLINGKATPTEAIPTAPAPCSQGWNDGEGGALYMRDGNLTVIDCIFENNQAADLGPDTGGGAIYVVGSKHGTVIVGSTFTGNKASNAGALGGLFCEHHIYNSLFTDNTATGHDANNNDPGQCDAMNNGQNEIGSGGNGGAIYSDGQDVNVLLCGDQIVNNYAGDNAFGGGLFFTSNNYGGSLSITDTTMTDNTGGSWTNVQSGSITSAGSAVGTNCQSITIENSTIQGYP